MLCVAVGASVTVLVHSEGKGEEAEVIGHGCEAQHLPSLPCGMFDDLVQLGNGNLEIRHTVIVNDNVVAPVLIGQVLPFTVTLTW